MENVVLPVPLAKIFMRVVPADVLSRMIDVLMRKMAHRHPRLFKNLDRLGAALVIIEPSDLPHVFALRFGGQPASLTLVKTGEKLSADAHIKGRLKDLLDLLEGNIDGDTLFFTRTLVVTGNTSVIVGLRNTLDREGFHIMDDILSLAGPFARPVGRGLNLLNRVAHKVKENMRNDHAQWHLGDVPHTAEQSSARLNEEIENLKNRLAKCELKLKRTEGVG